MPVDHIRYDLLTQQALRGVLRRVLTDAARNGLPGEHHFYVTFDTRSPGVRLSARLREEYPDAMTIVLQHQFWDLAVTEHSFEVGLSFHGVMERLHIPFEAVTGFFDPSVQFGLQFETVSETEDAPAADKSAPAQAPAQVPAQAEKTARPRRKPVAAEQPAAENSAPAKADASAETSPPDKPAGGAPSGGAEVVRLDRFRKK